MSYIRFTAAADTIISFSSDLYECHALIIFILEISDYCRLQGEGKRLCGCTVEWRHYASGGHLSGTDRRKAQTIAADGRKPDMREPERKHMELPKGLDGKI